MHSMRLTSIYPLQSGLFQLVQLTVCHPCIHTTTIGSIEPGLARAGTITLRVKPLVNIRNALFGAELPRRLPHNLHRLQLGLSSQTQGPRASLQVAHSGSPAQLLVGGKKDRTQLRCMSRRGRGQAPGADGSAGRQLCQERSIRWVSPSGES